MGGKLSKAFSHSEPESYKGQIHFKNVDVYNEFVKNLDEMFDSGKHVEVDGVDSIVVTQTIDGTAFPMTDHKEITKAYFFPHKEPVNITTHSDYGDFTWELFRMRLRDKIVLSNSEKSVIYVKITAVMAENTMQISFKSNPQYAESINSIIESHAAILSLLERFFANKPSELAKTASNLQNDLALWERIHALEEIMGISFKPSIIEFETINEIIRDLELMHMQLVRKRVVRENKGLTSIKANFNLESDTPTSEPVINREMALFYSEASTHSIWGAEINLFSACVAFGHIVDSIEKDAESDTTIISFKEKASNPRFVSTQTFATEEERDAESERLAANFNENYELYRSAKTLEVLYRELILGEASINENPV